MLKLMTWNIRHGGGAKGMPLIALYLVEQGADVIVLTEFRRSTGGQIRGVLADHGWAHQAVSEHPGRANGVLVASRLAMRAEAPPPEAAGRWQEVVIGNSVRVVGLHIPCTGRETGRKAFWHKVLQRARAIADEPAVLIGDFNTGRRHLDEAGATFQQTAMLGMLSAAGYVDAWRVKHPHEREYSWFSHAGSGFRIDHAMVSRRLAGGIQSAWFCHEQRVSGTSDHASLVVVVDDSGASEGEKGVDGGCLSAKLPKKVGPGT